MRYTEKFKAKVIEAVTAGMTKAAAERKFKVSYQTITKWVADDVDDANVSVNPPLNLTAGTVTYVSEPDTQRNIHRLHEALLENAKLRTVVVNQLLAAQ